MEDAKRHHGKACRWGHGTERYVKHDCCVVCAQINARKQSAKRYRSQKAKNALSGGASESALADRVPPLVDFRGEQ